TASCVGKRIEAPALDAFGGVQRDDLQLRRRSVEHSADDERIALDLGAIVLAGVAGMVGPRHGQARDVALSDLAEWGVMRAGLVAQIGRPFLVGGVEWD